MKKIYQIPETEIISTEYSRYILADMSGEINNPMSNEGKTFEEVELSTDVSNTSLWDD